MNMCETCKHAAKDDGYIYCMIYVRNPTRMVTAVSECSRYSKSNRPMLIIEEFINERSSQHYGGLGKTHTEQ